MAKVAVFLADGFEEVEAMAPIDILRRGSIDVTTVSIMGRKEVHGSHGIDVMADALIEDTDLDAMDMLVLPGGKMGTQNEEACKALTDKVKEFDAAGKYVAAICAAPTILGHLGIVNGRKATCYGGLEGELKGADTCTDPVVVDGHIITSRGMGTSVAFGLKLLEIFTGKESTENMAKAIMVP